MSRAWGSGSTRAWRTVRARVLTRDGHTRQLRSPGCTGHATEVDHINERRNGGTDQRDNLRAVCKASNN